MAEFCRGQDYMASGLSYWARRLSSEAVTTGRGAKSVSLVRVVRTASGTGASEARAPSAATVQAGAPNDVLALELGELRVRVPARLEDKVLEALLTVSLRSASAGAP